MWWRKIRTRRKHKMTGILTRWQIPWGITFPMIFGIQWKGWLLTGSGWCWFCGQKNSKNFDTKTNLCWFCGQILNPFFPTNLIEYNLPGFGHIFYSPLPEYPAACRSGSDLSTGIMVEISAPTSYGGLHFPDYALGFCQKGPVFPIAFRVDRNSALYSILLEK